jgi:Na+-translocating ferredoxin:NAD+ oxidoreductase RnfA subunit
MLVFIQRVGRKSLRLVRVKYVLQSEHTESWYRSAILFLHVHTHNCIVLRVVTLCRTDPKTNNEFTRFDGNFCAPEFPL